MNRAGVLVVVVGGGGGGGGVMDGAVVRAVGSQKPFQFQFDSERTDTHKTSSQSCLMFLG